jgi:predicted RNA-binding protein YlxR (DUF448 family)
LGKAISAEEDEEGPLRTCIVTREKLSPDEMIRFVAGPEGLVVPDLKRKLPGRGVWVRCSVREVSEAVRCQTFGRGLKTRATAAATLPADIDRLLERDALQALAMANKAGCIVSGSAKVESAIQRGLANALLHARDAGPDGVRKLDQTFLRHTGEQTAGREKVELFESAQLDLALGRTNVIHAAVKRGAAGDFFLSRCRRLAAYRSPGDVAAPAAHLARNPDPPGSREPLAPESPDER